MTIILDDSEIKSIEKKVFLTLESYIKREIKSELRKILLAKKRERNENQLSFL